MAPSTADEASLDEQSTVAWAVKCKISHILSSLLHFSVVLDDAAVAQVRVRGRGKDHPGVRVHQELPPESLSALQGRRRLGLQLEGR